MKMRNKEIQKLSKQLKLEEKQNLEGMTLKHPELLRQLKSWKDELVDVINKQVYPEFDFNSHLKSDKLILDKIFDFHGNKLAYHTRALLRFLELNPTIIALSLNDCSLNDETAILLASNQTLSELYLNKNNIGNLGAQALAQNKKLHYLELFENNLSESGRSALDKRFIPQHNLFMDDLDQEHIYKAFDFNPFVENERLELFSSLKFYHRQIAELMQFLEQHPSITHLTLRNCSLNDDMVAILATNTTLTSLDLFSNHLIGNQTAIALANMRALRHLNLEHTNISTIGAKALAESDTLEWLNVSNNKKIDDEGVLDLLFNLHLKGLKMNSLYYRPYGVTYTYKLNPGRIRASLLSVLNPKNDNDLQDEPFPYTDTLHPWPSKEIISEDSIALENDPELSFLFKDKHLIQLWYQALRKPLIGNFELIELVSGNIFSSLISSSDDDDSEEELPELDFAEDLIVHNSSSDDISDKAEIAADESKTCDLDSESAALVGLNVLATAENKSSQLIKPALSRYKSFFWDDNNINSDNWRMNFSDNDAGGPGYGF